MSPAGSMGCASHPFYPIHSFRAFLFQILSQKNKKSHLLLVGNIAFIGKCHGFH